MAKDVLSGGTEAGDVPADVFAMPPGMSIRYDRPAPDIAESITGYHVYATGDAPRGGQVDWFLPGTANIRIALDAGPITVDIAGKHYLLPAASLFGPTSHAIRATTNGGVMIGIGISALGWARLTTLPAARVHDRVVPLGEVIGAPLAERLLAALTASDREHEVKPVLDAILRAALRPPHPDAPLVRAIAALIATDSAFGAGEVAAQLNITPKVLRRIAVTHFGVTPKSLLTRARFLRSFLRLYVGDDPADYSVIDRSYCDVPHFLRDANHYLGMTPRRFIATQTPFLRASVRARAAVLGAATQALHDPTRAAGG